MITLVIYDIPDDDLRLKVMKYLKSKGLRRVQKSAYAGPLTHAQRAELVAALRRLIKGRQANVQVYPLTEASFNQRVVLGVELRYDEEDRLVA